MVPEFRLNCAINCLVQVLQPNPAEWDLDLAIVKNIVENFSGTIWFETELGKGTTFYLEIPVYEESGKSNNFLPDSKKSAILVFCIYHNQFNIQY